MNATPADDFNYFDTNSVSGSASISSVTFTFYSNTAISSSVGDWKWEEVAEDEDTDDE